MVTYREQSDYREPFSDKSVDEYNGPYYGQASARVPPEYGSLRRNGQRDEIDAQVIFKTKWFTYSSGPQPVLEGPQALP